jgi:two-component sensor histidine kinase
MLDCEGLAIASVGGVLAVDGPDAFREAAARAIATRSGPKPQLHRAIAGQGRDAVDAVSAPILRTGVRAGTLVAFARGARPGLVRATGEAARWVSTQLELAELDASRAALAEAEVKALRAQISPHFIYNALTAIASFIHTDPAKARELVLEFADFTRYSFRRNGDFTTVAEELRSVDGYLRLERARFGDRLEVTLQIAPELLATVIPFLSVQPLVENAVRHGLESTERGGRVTITASDAGACALITVEDDGVGIDPELARLRGVGVDEGGDRREGVVDEVRADLGTQGLHPRLGECRPGGVELGEFELRRHPAGRFACRAHEAGSCPASEGDERAGPHTASQDGRRDGVDGIPSLTRDRAVQLRLRPGSRGDRTRGGLAERIRPIDREHAADPRDRESLAVEHGPQVAGRPHRVALLEARPQVLGGAGGEVQRREAGPLRLGSQLTRARCQPTHDEIPRDSQQRDGCDDREAAPQRLGHAGQVNRSLIVTASPLVAH